MKLIILLGQRVRSGTNFIGSTLSLHPDVQTVPPEKSYAELNLFKNRAIEDALRNITHSFGLAYDEVDKAYYYRKYGELCIKQIIDKFNLKAEEPIFIKSPFIKNYDLWLKAFPQAKFIVLSRDGRDNVISSVKASNDKRIWHNFNIKFKKRFNYYSGRSFFQHTKNWKKTALIYYEIKNSSNLVKVKYEDLISSIDDLQNLFKFLELEVSPSILKTCRNAPVVGSSFGDSDGKVSRPNWRPEHDKSKFVFTSRWKQWGWFKKKIFKEIAGEQLINLGYEKNNKW